MATQLNPHSRNLDCSEEEWQLRQQLAACYRIFDHIGWAESIFNPISVKIPGEEGAFLINPYGLFYSEVCASNLVKIDIAGNTLDGFARVPLARGLSLVLRGENLTGETIVTRNQAGSIDLGVPRTVWAGVRVGF